MLSIPEAFDKFRQNLEVKKTEDQDAMKRQKRIRAILNEKFCINEDFLTGSYARHTKIRPLKDVDIFIVLNEAKEGHRRKKGPQALLDDVRDALAEVYKDPAPTTQRRSVQLEFPRGEFEGEERVLGFDVVPAYKKGDHYEIPDVIDAKQWIETNPRIHKDKATTANKEFNQKWKPLVKMLKKWNATHDKPVKPSFLIEVMCLEILRAPCVDYAREIKTTLATISDRIHEDWADPAGLGPPVSDQMDAQQLQVCRQAIADIQRGIDQALRLEQQGNIGGALRIWRDEVFGPMFPLS